MYECASDDYEKGAEGYIRGSKTGFLILLTSTVIWHVVEVLFTTNLKYWSGRETGYLWKQRGC